MNPPRSEGFVRMPDAEFEAILTRAAEEGAKRAWADVALIAHPRRAQTWDSAARARIHGASISGGTDIP